MNFGISDIMAISSLALDVYTAYKNAPDDYKHISDEVRSLQIIINKAARHLESTALSKNNWLEGQEVLRGCQNVLEDLDSLIEKYDGLGSANARQVLKRVKLGGEDIATLRARLTSNTTLLSSFIQSCELLEMQSQLTDVLGLYRTNSRVSIDSVTSLPGSVNTKKAFKKFFKGLYEIGVTAEMIRQKEGEIRNIFKPQKAATISDIDGSTFANQNQLPEVVDSCSDTDSSPISTISTERRQNRNRSRFGWARPPIDFLVGPQMLAAARAGNTKRLISALGHIHNVNFEDDLKETSLHKAAVGGHDDIVRLLLKKGASIEAINKNSYTPLHLAALNGHTSTVELLLTRGASIEATTKSNSTPLHRAAWNGHTNTVELLLTKGASIEAMNIGNNTPLHHAARNGHTSTVELLLTKGASIKATDTNGNTPLHFAAWYGHTRTVELLLTKGSVEAINKYNHTPLHNAAWNGRTSTVELLLTKGASIKAMSKDNDTPLHLAAWDGHTGTVELLLMKDAPIEAMNKSNNTPLHLAARYGYTDTVELLLSKGASIEALNEDKDTPLHLAAWYGYTDTVELLLTKGAFIEAMNNDKNTPLHLAASMGRHTSIRVVELLLGEGASIEAMNKNDDTPLHLAAQNGHTIIVDLLLRKGSPFEVMKSAPLKHRMVILIQ